MSETLVNGYHLFSLSAREPQETISFAVHTNEMGDGYDDNLLFGSDTGLRKFALDFPVLDMNTASCTLDGVNLKPAEYLWELFCRQKVDNTPFVIQSPRNSQYYLCKFIDNNLTMKGIYRRLFTGSAMFQQVRRSGVSVFSPSQNSRVSHWYRTPITGAADNTALPDDTWNNEVTGGEDLNAPALTDVTYQTNEQNSLAVVRVLETGTSGRLETSTSTAFYEAFMVLKVREATFAEHRGIISNNDSAAGSPALLGADGTTKFFDLGFGSGYEYRLNGTSYAEANQQAPMNAFGIVHIRRTAGWTMANGLMIGQDRYGTYPERAANIDIGEIIITNALLPPSDTREIMEYLNARWSVQ